MTDRLQAAWCEVLGVDALRPFQVIVDPGRNGIGVLALQDTVTVSVPDGDLVERVDDALCDLSADEITDVATLRRRLPVAEVLGPASLFYRAPGLGLGRTGASELVTLDGLASLIGAAPEDDVEESGITRVTSDVSIERHGGEVVAACGWQAWPGGIAHLGVLTHPDHRGKHLARWVGVDAILRASSAGLIPQWRARVEASKAVARSIGLVELGAQLRVRLDG